ncbi:hypothetical protein NL676_035491 [Syzygium grande]|nr:hypothetical protein NL676_035491 [Syzygium grande]
MQNITRESLRPPWAPTPHPDPRFIARRDGRVLRLVSSRLASCRLERARESGTGSRQFAVTQDIFKNGSNQGVGSFRSHVWGEPRSGAAAPAASAAGTAQSGRLPPGPDGHVGESGLTLDVSGGTSLSVSTVFIEFLRFCV